MNSVWQGVTWLKLGWLLFRQQPITWAVIALIFAIAGAIGASSTIGQFVVSLLAPVLFGGVFLTMNKSARGEKVQIEGVLSAFKHKPTLKQLLLIGLIGTAITATNMIFTELGLLVALPWMLASIFAVPLVAIKHQQAIPALQSSFWVCLVHIISILPFLVMVVLLTVVAILPAGLGLLVLLPVLLCSIYSAFSTIYLEPLEGAEATDTAEPIKNAVDSIQSTMPPLSTTASPATQEPVEQTFSEDLEVIPQQQDHPPAAEVTLPEGWDIKYFEDYIFLSRRWLGAKAYMPVLFLLIFVGVNYFLFNTEMDTSNIKAEQWFIDLMPWLLSGLPLVAGYISLAQYFNHTDIYVSADTIEIKQRPIPWLGNKRLQAGSIKQLYVKEIFHAAIKSRHQFTDYHVQVISNTDSNYTLLPSLEKDQALFVEQEIEKFLNITNVPL